MDKAMRTDGAAPEATAEDGGNGQYSELSPVRILVVDDDRPFGNMLKSALTRCGGFACLIAADAREALDYLNEGNIDVVITDINMPDMSGLELTQIIKSRYAADVIVITGYNEDFSYEEAIDHGANDFIEKPVRPTELIIRLKRVLRERAIARMQKEMEEERKLSFARLRKALGATIQALAVAAEIRDPYTAGHQRRVADLARTIATKMGFPADRIEGLRMASSIHDIGKISVPSEILSMPRKLTDTEFCLIKTHSQAGYDILKDIEFPWPIAKMVIEHHERMDGSGYPNRLRGDQILMESRIIAVSDVVEAIASHRPYRPGLGIETALEEITRNKGVSYDAEAVHACLHVFREEGYQLVS